MKKTFKLTLPKVEIFVDGACSGNPGPGGWAAIIKTDNGEDVISGAKSSTTNNRMELRAAIAGLESLTQKTHVTLYSDSRYVIDGATIWIHKWKQRGWLTVATRRVKNLALWQRLDIASDGHVVEWAWVKGHDGRLENERADRLARATLNKLRRPPQSTCYEERRRPFRLLR